MADGKNLPNTNLAKAEQTKARLRYTLEELVRGVSPVEAHESGAEIDWGPDVGREITED